MTTANQDRSDRGEQETGPRHFVSFEGTQPQQRNASPEEEFVQSIFSTVREALLVLTTDLRVKSANRAFYQMFQITPGETEGRLVYDLDDREWDIPVLHEVLEEVLPHHKVVNDYEVTHDFTPTGKHVMLLNARRLDCTKLSLLAIEDITPYRLAERAKQGVEERYQSALQNSPMIVATLDRDLRYDWIFMLSNAVGASNAIGKRDDELDTGPGVDELMEPKRHALQEGRQVRREIVFDGRRAGTYDITLIPGTQTRYPRRRLSSTCCDQQRFNASRGARK